MGNFLSNAVQLDLTLLFTEMLHLKCIQPRYNYKGAYALTTFRIRIECLIKYKKGYFQVRVTNEKEYMFDGIPATNYLLNYYRNTCNTFMRVLITIYIYRDNWRFYETI